MIGNEVRCNPLTPNFKLKLPVDEIYNHTCITLRQSRPTKKRSSGSLSTTSTGRRSQAPRTTSTRQTVPQPAGTRGKISTAIDRLELCCSEGVRNHHVRLHGHSRLSDAASGCICHLSSLGLSDPITQACQLNKSGDPICQPDRRRDGDGE